MSSYNASKAAVVALSESLRYELGPWGVSVSVVCPSFFRTNLAQSLSGDDPQMEAGAVRLINEARRGADEIAVRVIQAVDARKFLIIPDSDGRTAYRAKRFARFLYDRKMFALGAKLRRDERAEAPHE
jgi:NAD(P)-dependent dehydrogenase (short-subunit alcohol dehydrogenase family)